MNLYVLTPREKQTARLIATGLSNKEIATEMKISVNTVKRFTQQVYDKLDVRSRFRLAVLLNGATLGGVN